MYSRGRVMVLDDLGKSLKGTIEKIATAVTVDKKLIKEVVRDIQRALLQSDVNVKLVLTLSKKIEKRALEEKPPAGMSGREHVIRIVYDELVKILGDARELPVKKQVIMLTGLYGQGKCVHGDSIIPLSSGEVNSAKSIYDHFASTLEERSVGDGTIIDLENETIHVPSFNPATLKIENKKVTHAWKLKGKQLYEIFIDAGNDYSVRVTPEHPFFILRNGMVLQARADQLQLDDYVAVPRAYKIEPEKEQVDLLPFIRQNNIDIFLEKNTAKQIISSKYDTIKNAVAHLDHSRNYSKCTLAFKKGKISLSLLEDSYCPIDSLKLQSFNTKKSVRFPRYLTKDLAEFLGYIIGDGHITKGTVEISNADEELIKRITKISQRLFGIHPTITKDKRSKAKRILLSSKTLAGLIHTIFKIPYGRKGRSLSLPNNLLLSSDEVLRHFIRAYVDCDGYIAKNYRNIAISSESKTLLNQITLLLRRYHIFSTLSKKHVNGVVYWKLCIEGRYAESFSRQIGSGLSRKKDRFTSFSQMGKKQGCGKHDMVPIGPVLKEVRESLDHSIGNIQQKAVNSYGIYEKKEQISRESLSNLSTFYETYPQGNLLTLLNQLKLGKNPRDTFNNGIVNALCSYFNQQGLIKETQSSIQLTSMGRKQLQQRVQYQKTASKNTLESIHNLSNSDVCWIKVRDIKTIDSPEYVYDFTVEDNHSFIADGIVVHNTTSAGKLATYFKKKGLRPAVVAGDVHRPAAYDQLKQIAEQVEVPFYGDKDEKSAVKVVETGVEKFKRSADVVIVDTSGRHKLEDDLIQEMKDIFHATKPDEKLLVIDAAVGQQAGSQAKAFNDAVDITGIILTKLDGTAKGGGALSAASEVDAPIVFIGTGEHATDFERFDPARFISRLLGMGDIKTLLEKAEESMKGKDAEKTARRMMSGKFTLHDMYDQMDMLSGMGPLNKISELLPGGMSKKMKNVDMDDTQDRLQRFRIIMDSMTEEEMENPQIIRSSRVRRIAKGAGVDNKDVKQLLKYYNMTKKMMKGFSSNRKMRKNLMKQLEFGK